MSEIARLNIQNRLLTEEVKRRVDQIAAIGTVATAVGQSLDLQETLGTALDAVVSVVGAEAAGISLIDHEKSEVVLLAQKGWVQDFVQKNPMRIPLGQGMSGRVISSDKVIVHNDLDGSETYAVPSFREEHFRSIAMAPMHARGKIIGILSIMSHTPNRFDEETVEVLVAIADTIGVALDNARLYENRVESETRLSSILQATVDGIIATDQNSRISVVNHAAETLLETKASRLLGMRLREAPIQPRLRDQLLFALSSSAAEEHRSFQVTLENERVVSVIVTPVHIESQIEQDSEADGWLIMLQDVTHLRKIEIDRAQFVQAAAHDMRNPLSVTNSAINMLDTLIENKDETLIEVIEIARTGIIRLERLIEDLLQIEKIESGFGFTLKDVNIRELCQEVSDEIAPLMAEKSIAFSYHLPDDLPATIPIDRNWINRALHNYLENAYKYTQKGGRVELKVYLDDPMLHFEVIDNGPGIPMKAQARLFERFYRVRETKDIHGSGLGLAIVKSVVEAHGGTVYVRSKPGDGSTFGLTLPMARENQHVKP